MKTLILAAIRCSLILTTVAALSVAYPAKANLVTNPGFETGDFNGYTGGSTELLFTFRNIPGSWLLDDVSVNPKARVPDGGSTVSLLGCALLGLAALRRKLGY